MSLNLFIIFTCIDSLLPVMQYLFFSEYISIIIKGICICRDHMSYCVPMYHRNKKISKTKLLLVPFVYDSKNVVYKYHRNENFSETNLLLIPFVSDEV